MCNVVKWRDFCLLRLWPQVLTAHVYVLQPAGKKIFVRSSGTAWPWYPNLFLDALTDWLTALIHDFSNLLIFSSTFVWHFRACDHHTFCHFVYKIVSDTQVLPPLGISGICHFLNTDKIWQSNAFTRQSRPINPSTRLLVTPWPDYFLPTHSSSISSSSIKPVFQASFWRKSSFSAISTKGRPPLHINCWKAMDLSFLTM